MKIRITVLAILLTSALAFGTHLKGGYIRIHQVTSQSLDYRITLRIYTSSSGVPFGGDNSLIDFGDGTSYRVPQQMPSMLDDDTGMVEYSVIHSYPGYGPYVVSYTEPNRNHTVNLQGSINTPFYVESFFNADPLHSGYASPVLLADPILVAPMESEFTYGISAVDIRGHQLNYEVRTPATKAGVTPGYSLPENFRVNAFNGLVSWDTKFRGGYEAGEYVFNIRIFQFKDDILMGYMTLEFPVVLHAHKERLLLTTQQSLDKNNRVYVEVGKNKTMRVFFEATESLVTTLEAYADLDPLQWTFSSYDSVSNATPIKAGLITIKIEPESIRNNPYTLTLRGSAASSSHFKKDITFLIFTKDVEVSDVPVILGVEEKNAPFLLYPNPVSNTLHLDATLNEIFHITILNLAGKIVYEGPISSKEAIPIGSLPPGVYYYDIHGAIKREHGKLVKK